jgi:hypothetical protein
VTETPVTIDGTGAGHYNLATFNQANVAKVVVVMTNAGTRFNCNKGTNFSCHGKSPDDSSSTDYNLTFTVS